MKINGTALMLALLLGGAVADASAFKIDFRGAPEQAGSYTAERGHGFDLGSKPGKPSPLFYSVKLPEGNYRVGVTLGDANEVSNTTVRAEAGQVLADGLITAPGQFITRTFIVNVRRPELPAPPPNAPGGTKVHMFLAGEPASRTWDEKLTLEFNGSQTQSPPRLAALEIVADTRVPTLFFAGDSTVANPLTGPGGNWPTHLSQFFKPEIAFSNAASGGETSKSFITGLRFDKVLSQMKAGDFFMIQFGHNDSKANWPQSYTEPATTFKAYLRIFIAETRRRGATPVLVTPMERRANGDTVGPWARAMLELAAEEDVAVIDQWSASKQLWATLGERVGSAFIDPTHLSGYGGYLLARLMIDGIRTKLPALSHYLAADALGMSPIQPAAAPAYLDQAP